MHIASESHFHGLRGSSGLKMTSEVKAEFTLNSVTSMSLVSMCIMPVVAILVASEAIAASK